MSWRPFVAAIYIGIPLACCIAWGGWAWFMFFTVWWLVWSGFSLFLGWAQRARAALLRPSSSASATAGVRSETLREATKQT